jgi:tight adherence protein C
MIAISVFLAGVSLILAASLFADYWKTRNTLLRRLSGLAPGAQVKQAQRTKRLRTASAAVRNQVDAELIDLIDMLAVIISSGETLFGAFARLTKLSSCRLAAEFDLVIQRTELGGQLDKELAGLCQRLPTPSIRELVSKLTLAMNRGTPLANALANLSKSLRVKHSGEILRRAGANETKMLIPVVLLVCPITIIFALFPSSQYLAVF